MSAPAIPAPLELLDLVQAPVRICTPDDGTVYVNAAWCALTGTRLEDNLGDGWLRCVCDEDRAALEAREAHDRQVSYRLRNGDGHEVIVSEVSDALRDPQSNRVLAHVTTVRTEAPPAIVHRPPPKWAHELRGPLNAILGWSDLLAAGETDPAVIKRGLQAISNNAREQARIIKRLSD